MDLGYMSAPFDLLNVEDLDVIEQARELCDQLVLGVWSDDLVEEVYGRPPVVGLEERLTLMSHLRGLHQVLVHDDVVVSELLRQGVDHVEVFAVADRPLAPGDHDVTLLRVRRETESVALRRAVAPALGLTDGGFPDVAVA